MNLNPPQSSPSATVLSVGFRVREIYPTILKAWRHLLDRDGSNCAPRRSAGDLRKTPSLLGAKGIATRSDRTLLGAPGLALLCVQQLHL